MPTDTFKNCRIMDKNRLVDDSFNWWVRPYIFKSFNLNTLYICQEMPHDFIKYYKIILPFPHGFRQLFHDIDSHDK